MFRLFWTSLRSRRTNLTGSLLAVIISVTMIYASIMLIKAASDGPGVTPRLGATALVIRANSTITLDHHEPEETELAPRIPIALASTIARLDGVAVAIPDVTTYAQALDAAGDPIVVSADATPRGEPWVSAALAPFHLVAGHAPGADDEIVVDAAIAEQGKLSVGDRVTIVSSEAPTTYRLVGIASPPSGRGLDRQATIFFTTPVALRLANANDSADLIGVLAQPGTDVAALKKRVTGALAGKHVDVLSGRARAQSDVASGASELGDFVAILGSLAGFVGFVSIFILASTFAFSIQQRHREIGLQRAIGVTPRQLWTMIAAEAIVLTFAGTLIGIALGTPLARALTWFAIRRGLAPHGFTAPFWFWAVPITLGAALGIALIAALGAGRRAAKIRPIEALREAAAPRRFIGIPRLLFGLACIIGGLAVLGIEPSLDTDAAVAISMLEASLLMVGCAILGPLVVLPFALLPGRLLAFAGGITGALARWNALRLPQRMASVVAPMILSVGFASLMFCLLATVQDATTQQTAARVQADLVVVPTNDGLPLGVTSAIDRFPGVAATTALVPSGGLIVDAHSGGFVEQDVALIGLDPAATGAVMRLQFAQGGVPNFRPGTVLLSEQFAKAAHLKLGDPATFYAEDQQPLRLTVAGIFSNSLGIGDALVPQSDLMPHVTMPFAEAVFVDLDSDTEASAVTQQINALAGDGYQLRTATRAEYVAGMHQSLVSGAWAIYLIIGSTAGLAGLAMVNTMIMSMGQRARELVLLRLIGATTRQVLLMIGSESILVLLIGAATGIAIGVGSVYSISVGLLGNGSALAIPLEPLAAIVTVAALLSIIAHVIPAWAVLRADPASQIGMKE